MDMTHRPSLTPQEVPKSSERVLVCFLVFLFWASVLGVFSVFFLGVFTFVGCLLWSLNLLMRVKSIYLGGRMNVIILQKQLSKSVQICKLFSRLRFFFLFLFLVLEEEELRGGGGGVGDFVSVRQSFLFMNSHV